MTSDKTYLVVGSGAREHAIVLRLLDCPDCTRIYVAPGNPGIYLSDPHKVKLVDINAGNIEDLQKWCIKNKPDVVIVGSEDPLDKGIKNRLNDVGIACFGPSKEAAQIESNKAFSKDFMIRHGIPTAKYKVFDNSIDAINYVDNEQGFEHGYVIKASGLAAGKGVIIAKNKDEARSCVRNILDEKQFGDAGSLIVVEEFIDGEECSVMAFSDGRTISVMPAAQDHKKVYNGDNGPNTGGMGAVCPFDLVAQDPELQEKINSEIIEKCIKGLADEGKPFVGVLFAGLMICENKELYTLEYNCRFGDPETQSVLPLLGTDLTSIIDACINERLECLDIIWRSQPYLCGVVIADLDYPNKVTKGQLIEGLSIPTRPDQFCKPSEYRSPFIIHAGTAFSNSQISTSPDLVTNGGRIITVVGLGSSVRRAQENALKQAERIRIGKSRYRTDIGHRCIRRAETIKSITYKMSGVDIDLGNKFVEYIKESVKKTHGPGVMSQIGSFGAFFDLKPYKMKDPVLVSGTDGVGTKLKLALDANYCDGLGIDLVAMCVNDILVHGATPLFFLDYFACGHLQLDIAKLAISGIIEGCLQANCSLIGGETAEMPGMYHENDFELAGFAVGAVERTDKLPRMDEIESGDVILGLSSSGLHSNGFSLVRKLIDMNQIDVSKSTVTSCYVTQTTNSNCVYNIQDSFTQAILKPTTIYVKQMKLAMERKLIKACAHITGGGLIENIPRSLPDNLCARLDANSWHINPLFGWIQKAGQVKPKEMLKTFNCGLGMVCFVGKSQVDEAIRLLSNNDAQSTVFKVGQLETRSSTLDQQCIVDNISEALDRCAKLMKPAEDFGVPLTRHSRHRHDHHHHKRHSKKTRSRQINVEQKRVAILLSGTGTNAKAIMDFERQEGLLCAYKVALVVSNKPTAGGLELSKAMKVPTEVVKHTDYASRVDFDMAIDKLLVSHDIELVCLAGFMRVLSNEFVRKWAGKLINIHPSLLPAFKGMNAYKQALDSGARLTGCSIHFVNEGVDDGAIIAQRPIQIMPSDTEESLTERGKLVENQLYPEALAMLASGCVSYDATANKAVFSSS